LICFAFIYPCVLEFIELESSIRKHCTQLLDSCDVVIIFKCICIPDAIVNLCCNLGQVSVGLIGD